MAEINERVEKLTIEEAVEVINFVREKIGLQVTDIKNTFLNEVIDEIILEEITPQEGITKARAIVDKDNSKKV